jgi:hypothetical protein
LDFQQNPNLSLDHVYYKLLGLLGLYVCPRARLDGVDKPADASVVIMDIPFVPEGVEASEGTL